MDDQKIVLKVQDLGACAYLLMHGFKVKEHDRYAKAFVFELNEADKQDFEDTQTAYLNSEFHRFDACLMSLKKRWRS